jgi:hypothetical protein
VTVHLCGETKIADDVSLQFEVVDLPQIHDYLEEELPTHPETMAKYGIAYNGLSAK